MTVRQTLNDMIENLKEHEAIMDRLNLLLPNDIDLCIHKHLATYIGLRNSINLIKDEIKSFAKLNHIEIDLI